LGVRQIRGMDRGSFSVKHTMSLSLEYSGGIAIFDPDLFCDFLESIKSTEGNVFDLFVNKPDIGDAVIKAGIVVPIYPIDEDDYTIIDLNHSKPIENWKFSHSGFPLTVKSGVIVATDIFSLISWEHDFFRNYRENYENKSSVNDMINVSSGNYSVTIFGGLVSNCKTYGLLFDIVQELPIFNSPSIENFNFNI
jgi:hypothetical protein